MIDKLRNKELGILELFFIGFKVYRNNFAPILIVALFIGLPIALIQESLFPVFEEIDYAMLITLNQFILISTIFEVPAWIAVMNVVEQNALGTPVSWGLALRKGFSKWGATLGNSTLAGILANLLFLLFIIPGLIFIVRQFFFLEAVALRDLNGNSALSYSRSLVQGRWWKVFLTILALFINNLFLLSIIFFLLSIVHQFMPTFDFIIGTAYNFSAELLSYFFIVVGTLFFLNLEYRKN